MFCKNCGQEVADGAYICLHCGHKVAEEPKKQSSVTACDKKGDIPFNNKLAWMNFAQIFVALLVGAIKETFVGAIASTAIAALTLILSLVTVIFAAKDYKNGECTKAMQFFSMIMMVVSIFTMVTASNSIMAGILEDVRRF